MELYLLGESLHHSMSPFLHHSFLKQIGQEGTYRLKEIKKENFKAEMLSFKKTATVGFNVTIPYKVDILPFLDDMSDEAKEMGAVNTVVVKNGRWIGYNTDGTGYVTSLKYHFNDVLNNDSHILVLGAGGASRGIVHALSKERCASITIANRTIEKALEIKKMVKTKKELSCVDYVSAMDRLDQFNCIINTTSVGMTPDVFSSPIQLDNMKPEMVVSDIIYRPFHTMLLKEAKKRGAFIHHGHEMLVYQAAQAFYLWTGERVDVRPVITAFEKELQRKD